MGPESRTAGKVWSKTGRDLMQKELFQPQKRDIHDLFNVTQFDKLCGTVHQKGWRRITASSSRTLQTRQRAKNYPAASRDRNLRPRCAANGLLPRWAIPQQQSLASPGKQDWGLERSFGYSHGSRLWLVPDDSRQSKAPIHLIQQEHRNIVT